MIHNKFRYLMTLVALFAMTAGAWADYTVTWRGNTLKGIAVNKAYAIPISAPSETTVKGITLTANVGFFFYRSTGANPSVNLTSGAPDGLVFSAETNIKSIEFTFGESACFNGTVAATPGTGGYTLTTPAKSFGIPRNDWVYDITKVVFTLEGEDPNPNEVDLDFNNAMTEAEFDMPASDVTIDYEIVRDMSVQMTAQVGDGTEEQPRYRVQKVEGDYVPADLNAQQVMALFSVTDLLENNKVLTQTTDYTVNIYAIDDQGEPTGDAMTFANFAFEPGHYAVKAVAVDGSYYDGETALSNIFTLYEKEITVHPEAIEGLIYSGEPQVLITPAECIGGEMRYSLDGENWSADLPEATDEGTYTVYYKVIADENDDDPFYETVENIVITEMPMEQAVQGLFDAIYHAAETLSKGQYVHTEEENDALSAVIYDGAELYAAANKPNNEVTSKQVVDMIVALRHAEEAYLNSEEVVTGIDNVNRNDNDNVNGNRYYDLNGRRVAQPTKGVYILNGKKVVIK